MANLINIKKGLDIPLQGKASSEITADTLTDLFAITPDDFPGYTWKTAVKAGDAVECGSPLLYAKECEDIVLSSPVSGIVEDIHRGERRKVEFISVKKQGEQTQVKIDRDTPVLSALRRSGLFAMLRQRPYDILPDKDAAPRDIFVTAFDTAPLAPAVIADSDARYLESGL